MKIFTQSEEITNKLRRLYEEYGYRRFKMSKFEEYSFYMDHKSFLTEENIISFSDLNGKLLALKPDITLSIAKNAHDDETSRVYYNENVYRASRGIHEYKEIPQVGLEFIGNTDTYSECETVLLAVKSMEMLGGEFTVDLSHMGVISSLLDENGFTDKTRADILSSLAKKDSDEIYGICKAAGADENTSCRISSLADIHGSFDAAYEKVCAICGKENPALTELKTIFDFLRAAGKDEHVNLDFSIINDMNYYNGIVFQGYLEGVPRNVLSGGRYDNLIAKLGKKCGACGFALYLDLIELYREDEEREEADIAIIYSEKDDICKIEKTAGKYRNGNRRVIVVKEGASVKAKKIIKLDDAEAEI